MAIEVKHATQAVGTDAGNGEIGKSEWNESHNINMASGNLLGRSSAGAGTVEEIAVGTGLSLSAGTLSGYSNADVDAHLNTSTATSNQVLSWTGSDYDWVAQSGLAGTGGITTVAVVASLPGSPDANTLYIVV